MGSSWLGHRGLNAGALVVAALLAAAAFGVPSAEGQNGLLWHGGAPHTSGVHLATWNGGSIVQAAATPGARSLWVTVEGRLEGYVVGAPAFVNAQFRARFPDGMLAAGTPIVVVIDAPADESPIAIVEGFLADLELAAPPQSQEHALIRSLSRLTEAARARFSTSGELAGFLGVQDLPDAGVMLRLASETQTEVRVYVQLGYTGGDAEREFVLAREHDRWRIDWIDAFPLDAGSSPDAVVRAFIAHFIASAPPAPTPRPSTRAAELLTVSTRDALPTDLPLSSALAGLVGVQDVPDQGFEVGSPVIQADQATVAVVLHYSGGDTARTVSLVLQDEGWRIARISP